MKPVPGSFSRRSVAQLGWLIIGLLAGRTMYSCAVAGPALTSSASGAGVLVQSRFLGEYALGFERVRISETDTGAVVCDFSGDLSSDIHLAAGLNLPDAMFGPGRSAKPLPEGADACRLDQGRPYSVTVWGNNGWGYVRSTTVRVQL